MTRAQACLACALVFAVGSCTARYGMALDAPAMSPAQEVRARQFEDAYRETFRVERNPDCARRLLHLGPARGDGAVTCITQMQLDRMPEEAKP